MWQTQNYNFRKTSFLCHFKHFSNVLNDIRSSLIPYFKIKSIQERRRLRIYIDIIFNLLHQTPYVYFYQCYKARTHYYVMLKKNSVACVSFHSFVQSHVVLFVFDRLFTHLRERITIDYSMCLIRRQVNTHIELKAAGTVTNKTIHIKCVTIEFLINNAHCI